MLSSLVRTKTVFVAVLILLVGGCKTGIDGGGSFNPDDEFGGVDNDGEKTFFGPGGHWELLLDEADNTFTLRERTSPSAETRLTLTGNYQSRNNDLMAFTIKSVNGGNATNYFVDEPVAAIRPDDSLILLNPVSRAGNQIIALTDANTCPSANTRGGWVTLRPADSANVTRSGEGYFGVYQYDRAATTGFVNDQFNLTRNFSLLSGETLEGDDCAEGLAIGEDAHHYLGSHNTALIHRPDEDGSGEIQLVFASRELTTLVDMEGSYRGLIYDGAATSGSRARTAELVCGDAGDCMATVYSDFFDDTLSDEELTLSLTGTPDALADGFITGTVTNADDDDGNLACHTNLDIREQGRQFIACVGQAPEDNTRLFNLLVHAP